MEMEQLHDMDKKIFQFRSENKLVVMKMRVASSDKFYIYFGETIAFANNTLGIKVSSGLIEIYTYSNQWGVDKVMKMKDKSFSMKPNDIYEFWLQLGINKKLTIGTWNNDNEVKTLTFIEIPNLGMMNFIAFSSFMEAKWEVQNGKIKRCMKLLLLILLFSWSSWNDS